MSENIKNGTIQQIQGPFITGETILNLQLSNTLSYKIGISIGEKDYMEAAGTNLDQYLPTSTNSICFNLNGQTIVLGKTNFYQTQPLQEVTLECLSPSTYSSSALIEIVYYQKQE